MKQLRISASAEIPDDAFAQAKILASVETARDAFQKALSDAVGSPVSVDAAIVRPTVRLKKDVPASAVAAPVAVHGHTRAA